MLDYFLGRKTHYFGGICENPIFYRAGQQEKDTTIRYVGIQSTHELLEHERNIIFSIYLI